MSLNPTSGLALLNEEILDYWRDLVLRINAQKNSVDLAQKAVEAELGQDIPNHLLLKNKIAEQKQEAQQLTEVLRELRTTVNNSYYLCGTTPQTSTSISWLDVTTRGEGSCRSGVPFGDQNSTIVGGARDRPEYPLVANTRHPIFPYSYYGVTRVTPYTVTPRPSGVTHTSANFHWPVATTSAKSAAGPINYSTSGTGETSRKILTTVGPKIKHGETTSAGVTTTTNTGGTDDVEGTVYAPTDPTAGKYDSHYIYPPTPAT